MEGKAKETERREKGMEWNGMEGKWNGWGEEEEGGKRYLLLIMEPYLSGSHPGVLVQIRPGRVDDCHVIFLVACVYALSHGSEPSLCTREREKRDYHRLNLPWSIGRSPPLWLAVVCSIPALR